MLPPLSRLQRTNTNSEYHFEQRKLVVTFYVPLPLASTGEFRLAHNLSTPIKWDIEVDILSKILYIKPLDEEVNKKFEYELAIYSHRSEQTPPFYGKCSYDGKSFKCGLPLDFPVSRFIKIELIYPIPAVTFCSCSIVKTNVVPQAMKESNDPLKKMITKSRSRNEFCDMQFMVKENVIKAHKHILADRSEVFYKMFTSPVNDPATDNQPIVIENVSYEGFNHFIDTIYTGIIPTDPEICLEIVILAEKYDVQDVKEAVEDNVIASINFNNAIAVLITSDRNNAERIKGAALEFCAKNPVHEMAESESLGSLPDLMNEVFKAMYNQVK